MFVSVWLLPTELCQREKTVCTKTLYRYVGLGLLPLKNIDLPEKLSRNTKQHEAGENKINLGKSIEERPETELRDYSARV